MNDPARKPWLFLDVDGVINPGGYSYRAESVDSGATAVPDDHLAIRVTHKHMGEIVTFFPNVIVERLKALADVYDIVWLTTWADLARELEPHLGIESAGCLIARQRGFSDSTPRKGEALAEWLAGMHGVSDDDLFDNPDFAVVPQHRRFAWVDDQLYKFVHELGDGYRGPKVEWLGLCTLEEDGLTQAHTDALLAFAQGGA